MDNVDQRMLASVPDGSLRKEWIKLLRNVSRHGTYQGGFISLVRMAETDEHWEVRAAAIESLQHLADDRILAEAIVMKAALGQKAMAGLRDPSAQVRKAWASTLGRFLIGGNWKEGHDVLIDMAFHDNERDVRHHAYGAIDALLGSGSAPAASALAALTDALESVLKGNSYLRCFFTDFGSAGSHSVGSLLTLSNDLVSAVLHPLIKKGLVDLEGSHWMDCALTSFAANASSAHYKIIMQCVVENLGASSPRGAKKAMEMVSFMWQRSDPSWHVEPFIACLHPLFQLQSLTHVRAAAVDISSTIFSGEYSYSGTTDVMIPPLVSMAIQDPDNGLRNKAAELLSVICSSDQFFARREVAAPANIQRFLDLLSAPRPLNATVARLLGVLYQHDDAREWISLWVINKAVGAQDILSTFEHGILSLLSELVSKRILDSTVTLDYLLLLLSASLAFKGTPTTEPYRPLILTSLSLYYQNQIPGRQSETVGELARAFEYAAFGRHGTELEANAWLAMDQYLKDHPDPLQSLRQNNDVEQVNS
ncbi:armadillo-type protein [Coprinopsis sp. MPI-PUGE-AT-0042]|nr:armadillo-type protein [Coprinopsis sp. MPI-PUGE-AT-0042]